METVSVTALHVPLPVLVKVNRTKPAAISAPEGVYCAFSVFWFGVNVPVPVVDHVPVPVDVVPFSVAFGLLLQRKIVAPASTVGASVIVTTIESNAARHEPLPVEER